MVENKKLGLSGGVLEKVANFASKPAVHSLTKHMSSLARGMSGGMMAGGMLETAEEVFNLLGLDYDLTPDIDVEALASGVGSVKSYISEKISSIDLPEMPHMPDVSDIELPSISIDLSKFKDMDLIKVAKDILEEFKNDPNAGIEKLKELMPSVNISIPQTPEFVTHAKEVIEDFLKNGDDKIKKFISDELEKIQDKLDGDHGKLGEAVRDGHLGERPEPGITHEPGHIPTPEEVPTPEVHSLLHEVTKTGDKGWDEVFREQSNVFHSNADIGNREMIARIANGQFDLQGDSIKLPSDEVMNNFSQTMETAIKELGPVGDMKVDIIDNMSPDKIAALAGYFGDADRLAEAFLANDPSMMLDSRLGQVNEDIDWQAVINAMREITK